MHAQSTVGPAMHPTMRTVQCWSPRRLRSMASASHYVVYLGSGIEIHGV